MLKQFGVAAMIMLAGCAHAGQPECPDPRGARLEIERTVHAFFEALRNDDEAGFKRLTTEGFYAYDVGKRFPGQELVTFVRAAHDRGVQLNWSIGALDTKICSDVAWSAWENVGSAGIPPDIQNVRWLESAVLVRQDGSWKIDFFHSQRAVQD